ncbi:MAG: hypothetical protein ED859_14515 [Desulfuromonadales bacterium]|nr:MAG: hypothetical protein ED859_14515 [Desulfuromonadales bacterium]
MARPLRIEYPGAFYHVTSRGNEQKDIFKSRKDREKFLSHKGVRSTFYTNPKFFDMIEGNPIDQRREQWHDLYASSIRERFIMSRRAVMNRRTFLKVGRTGRSFSVTKGSGLHSTQIQNSLI